MIKICKNCAKSYTPSRYKIKTSRFCSIKCRQKGNGTSGSRKHANLTRGRGKSNNYIKFQSGHLHRHIAEKKIGRTLKKNEIVHHLNGNKHNNKPSNLIIMTNAAHSRLHSTKNRKCVIFNCGMKHLALNLCSKHYYREKRKQV